jgi:hypothetical protein
MRAVQRFRLPAMLLILIFGTPLGCTQQRSWDDYASKTETMKFLTFLPCDKFFIPALPEHQVYFHVTGMTPYSDGSYRVDYQRETQWTYEQIYFLSVLYVGLWNYTAISTAWMPSNAGAKCAALVVLPWSSVSRRPFSYPKSSELRALAIQSLTGAAGVDLCAFAALMLLLGCAMAGFSDTERDEKTICLIVSTIVVLLNAGVWTFNSFALSNINALTSFYEFYDALPRSGGHLLPLQWSQAHRLFDGPPHPASLTVNDDLFWIALCVSCAAWLVMYVRRVAIGIAYSTMADPFEELRLRIAQEGRLPTPEDYLQVLMQVGATASTWELELFKRRMKERFPDA